jgi:23S rRNA pseudouridine1911/1915/1917 synthase
MTDASAITRDSSAPERAIRFVAGSGDVGRRLDVVLAERLPNHSRTALKNLVKKGAIVVDGDAAKPSHVVEAGQVVTGTLEDDGRGPLKPEAIAFGILYEDATVLVLDKPAGLVVHPGSGRRDGTLANALAHHAAELSDVGGMERPGIVHRLDRDTSGVMVVAKSNAAHFALASQFHDRETKKEYRAIVEGEPEFDGDLIRKPLGRARHDPARVTIDPVGGKPAETAWEVLERFEGFTYLRCVPKTGRTHQIRVHLQSIGHPILCDATYGRRQALIRREVDPGAPTAEAGSAILGRQALHAFALEFHHPLHGKTLRFEAPLPPDFEAALAALRLYRRRKVR